MRFSTFCVLALSGAFSAASASPIRIIVTELPTPSNDANLGTVSLHPPVGLFAASAFAQPIVAAQDDGAVDALRLQHASKRPPCHSMRTKALDASNMLRQWLGLDPIHADAAIRVRPPMEISTDGGKEHLPVMPFIGTPVRPSFPEEQPMIAHNRDRQGRPPMRHHLHRIHHHQGPFLRRVHHALMALGPWEGRAVAFVLGCGIGVLLRMLWVMALVTARAFRGSRDEDAEYEVVFDEAEMLVPPPQYTIIDGSEVIPVDEKAPKEISA